MIQFENKTEEELKVFLENRIDDARKGIAESDGHIVGTVYYTGEIKLASDILKFLEEELD